MARRHAKNTATAIDANTESTRETRDDSDAKPATRTKGGKAGASGAAASVSPRGGTRKTSLRGSAAGEQASTENEAAACIATLDANGQVAPEGAPLTPGQTHRLVRDAEGKLTPVRKRFSSI